MIIQFFGIGYGIRISQTLYVVLLQKYYTEPYHVKTRQNKMRMRKTDSIEKQALSSALLILHSNFMYTPVLFSHDMVLYSIFVRIL